MRNNRKSISFFIDKRFVHSNVNLVINDTPTRKRGRNLFRILTTRYLNNKCDSDDAGEDTERFAQSDCLQYPFSITQILLDLDVSDVADRR